jgi:CcmD family protein
MTQAQPDSATLADPNARSTEFVAVQGGGDTTSAATLLVTAYLVMWALLLGFVFLSWRRQGRVETRISELEKSLASGGPKGSAAD